MAVKIAPEVNLPPDLKQIKKTKAKINVARNYPRMAFNLETVCHHSGLMLRTFGLK